MKSVKFFWPSGQARVRTGISWRANRSVSTVVDMSLETLWAATKGNVTVQYAQFLHAEMCVYESVKVLTSHATSWLPGLTIYGFRPAIGAS
jgi:hypothetical protein